MNKISEDSFEKTFALINFESEIKKMLVSEEILNDPDYKAPVKKYLALTAHLTAFESR
ncbi:MAG: hypothetical protein HY064_14360 [Bacteroidetes bacterium]|nr:hypothetical protein [Bacteroidota bacterium]